MAGFQRVFVSLESESNLIKSLLPEIIYNKVFVPVFLVWVENSTFKAFCFLPENEIAKLKNESCRGRKAMGLPTMAAIIGCPGRKATGLLIMAAIIWQAWLGLLGAQQGINNGSSLSRYVAGWSICGA